MPPLTAARPIGKQRIVWGIALFVSVLVGLGVAYSVWQPPRLNVVLITLDTTRADHLGCYGEPLALTETLDKLASRGVLFERAYATAPMTLPSHASIFTGLYPTEHGLRTNGKQRLSDEIPTLAELLQARGYETGAFVASFVLDSKFGLNRGFGRYGDDLTGADPTDEALHRNRSGNLVVDEALAWLNDQVQRPFFCWVHLYDPHFPYLDHREVYGDRFVDRPYDAEIAFVDSQVGRVLKFLEERHLGDKTLVIVAGDHGEGLGQHGERRHGMMLYNSTVHVPLIMALPGALPANRRIAAPVSLCDLFPTVLEALHVRGAGPVSGISLMPLANGAEPAPRGLYGETDEPFLDSGWSPLQSLITREWKYIRTSRVELYDMLNDPAETRNLAAEQGAQVESMERQLLDLESTLQPREGIDVGLSQDDQKKLISLGYLGNPQRPKEPGSNRNRRDIKDMIAHYNAFDDAHALLDAGEFEQAEQLIRGIVAAAPDYETAEIALGDVYYRQGKFDEAIAIYRGVLERNSDCSLAQFHLGDVRDAQGRFEEAVAHYREALRGAPDSSKLHYNMGRSLFRLGQVDQAVLAFQTALQLDPGFVFAHVELGSIFAQQGRFEEALTRYRTALKYDDGALPAHMNAAMVLSRLRRPAEALPHLERAARINPSDAEIQFQLGAFLASMGKTDRAIVHLREAVRLQPEHPQASDLLRRTEAAHPSGK